MSEVSYTKKYAATLRATRWAAEVERRRSLSTEAAIAEARESILVEDGDLVEVWADAAGGATKRIPLAEYATTIYCAP